jgi:arylsulfatase
MTASKPNILFFFTDQQRRDALGCTGGWVCTPNLDRVASEGVLFTQCVTNAPVCVPARVSLATGWYPHNTGVWRNGRATLPGDAPTWVRALRDSGYRTSVFGKTHYRPYLGRIDLRDSEHLLRAHGFDDINEVPGPRGAARIECHMTEEWEQRGLLDAYRRDMRARFTAGIPVVRPSPLGLEDYYDVYVGRQTAKYLYEYNHAQPWFCWACFTGPHEPWDVPEPYASMYDPEAVPAPIPYAADCWRPGPARPHGWLDKRLAKRGGRVSPRLAKRLRANYAGSVTLIDDLVGEILDVVRRRGELDRTVIVFSSDHGEMNGDFGLVGKSNMLDPAVRVPLIIRAPGARAPNTRFNEPVELFDLGPTLVELGGGALCHRQFGRSLVPVLEHPGAHHRNDALVELRREIMLFDPSWKMTVNARGDCYLLFDRAKDPEERQNMAGTTEGRDVERQLIARLRQRIEETQLHDGNSGLR